MISQFVIFTENLFRLYGAAGVFFASILEEVVAPIPSALVIMGAGFSFLGGLEISLSSIGVLLLSIVLPAALGITLGSLFIYGLAFLLGRAFLLKYGKYLGVSKDSLVLAEARFSAHKTNNFILFALRCVPVIPSVVISAMCGLLRFSIVKYITYTFLGTLVRAIFLGVAGWQAGALYKTYAEKIDLAENFIVLGLILVVIVVLVFRIFRKKA